MTAIVVRAYFDRAKTGGYPFRVYRAVAPAPTRGGLRLAEIAKCRTEARAERLAEMFRDNEARALLLAKRLAALGRRDKGAT